MNTNANYPKILAVLVLIFFSAVMVDQVPAEGPLGYNTEIPSMIMTPDTVKTRIGTLKFFDGIPTKETAALLYDNLDFMRGVETFLNGMPATSLEAMRVGLATLPQPSKQSQRDKMIVNDNGPIDLYFGPKGSRKNKFTELANRFRSDLAAPIERNHRNSNTLPKI